MWPSSFSRRRLVLDRDGSESASRPDRHLHPARPRAGDGSGLRLGRLALRGAALVRTGDRRRQRSDRSARRPHLRPGGDPPDHCRGRERSRRGEPRRLRERGTARAGQHLAQVPQPGGRPGQPPAALRRLALVRVRHGSPGAVGPGALPSVLRGLRRRRQELERARRPAGSEQGGLRLRGIRAHARGGPQRQPLRVQQGAARVAAGRPGQRGSARPHVHVGRCRQDLVHQRRQRGRTEPSGQPGGSGRSAQRRPLRRLRRRPEAHAAGHPAPRTAEGVRHAFDGRGQDLERAGQDRRSQRPHGPGR